MIVGNVKDYDCRTAAVITANEACKSLDVGPRVFIVKSRVNLCLSGQDSCLESETKNVKSV